jgi:hypothetical protein
MDRVGKLVQQLTELGQVRVPSSFAEAWVHRHQIDLLLQRQAWPLAVAAEES